MKLREWNARLHGLVVFRSLLDDPVVAKFADLTDRMEAGAPGCGPVCDAVAQFEAALFEHTTNWGSYLSAAVLEAETVCVRQAAAGTLAPALQTALDLPVPASPYSSTLLAGIPASRALVLAMTFSRSFS